jgi:hypothetical protein
MTLLYLLLLLAVSVSFWGFWCAGAVYGLRTGATVSRERIQLAYDLGKKHGQDLARPYRFKPAMSPLPRSLGEV